MAKHQISERVLERRRALTAVTNAEDALTRAHAAVERAGKRIITAKKGLEAAEKAKKDAEVQAGSRRAELALAREHLIEVTGLQVVDADDAQPALNLPDTI